MSQHFSETGSIEEDSNGFIRPRCYCGKAIGTFPNIESAVDALMDHAYIRGIIEGREEGL